MLDSKEYDFEHKKTVKKCVFALTTAPKRTVMHTRSGKNRYNHKNKARTQIENIQ